MFGPRFNEQKLKVNLGLVQTRLKLMEKKKTDLALRARPEIAEYVRNAKTDRARVRVESIIREDYLVEAMELVEMYADLLQGRVGLMKQSKVLEENLKTPISTLIWAAPRLGQYCQELKIVQNLLGAYYGKKYVEACLSNQVGTVCERVMVKLDPTPPKKVLVEQYLIEICKVANVEFTPDPRVMAEELEEGREGVDTDFMDFNNKDFPGDGAGGSGGGGGGGSGGQIPSFSYAASASAPFAQQPARFVAPAPYNPEPQLPYDPAPMKYPTGSTPNSSTTLPPYSPTDPNDEKQAPPLPSKSPNGSPGKSESLPSYNDSLGPPGPSRGPGPVAAPRSGSPGLGIPDLPSVPTRMPGDSTGPGPNHSGQDNNEEVDFDDLSRRFENLRKKT